MRTSCQFCAILALMIIVAVVTAEPPKASDSVLYPLVEIAAKSTKLLGEEQENLDNDFATMRRMRATDEYLNSLVGKKYKLPIVIGGVYEKFDKAYVRNGYTMSSLTSPKTERSGLTKADREAALLFTRTPVEIVFEIEADAKIAADLKKGDIYHLECAIVEATAVRRNPLEARKFRHAVVIKLGTKITKLK